MLPKSRSSRLWSPPGRPRASGVRVGCTGPPPGDLMDISKIWGPGARGCAGPDPWSRPRAEWAEAGAAGRKTKRHRVAEGLAPGRALQRGRGSQRGRARAARASAEPGGGRRRAAGLRLILRGFPLSESAFGDTGTKAVHHITARPGGSQRSRRLIRGERVGRRGGRRPTSRRGPRLRARTRGAGKGLVGAPASAGARSEGGGNRYLEHR